jgi:hypothetical protein
VAGSGGVGDEQVDHRAADEDDLVLELAERLRGPRQHLVVAGHRLRLVTSVGIVDQGEHHVASRPERQRSEVAERLQ